MMTSHIYVIGYGWISRFAIMEVNDA